MREEFSPGNLFQLKWSKDNYQTFVIIAAPNCV